MALTEPMLVTLGAVLETLIADPDFDVAGLSSRLGEEVHARLPSDRARRDLEQLLRLMGSGFGGAVLFQNPRPFADMKPEERDAALRRMSRSLLGKARLGFKGLKSVAGLLWGNPPAGHQEAWPPWEVMRYPGPDGSPPAPPTALATKEVEGDSAWEADVVVVGSGAGGGVAAAVLAAAGLDVVVLEKGGDNREADYPRREPEAFRLLYQGSGTIATKDGGIGLLAGSTLGGGTVVNYTTSFATPGDVREEWDEASGLAGVFTGEDFDRSAAAVAKGFGVTKEESVAPRREELLELGLQRLGWHVEAQPRNVAGCDPKACGSCGMGCRIGAKQSTLRTWLTDAAAAGGRIVANASVERILIERGRAVGVRASVGGHRLVVRAKAVVLAAGALNTPALMMRSGLTNRSVGSGLRLHPATAVWARFDEDVEPWTGMLQARYSDQFADLDGKGYGVRFETAPVHPTFPGMFLGWDGGARFYEDLRGLRRLTPFGILLRDRGKGRVKVRSTGGTYWDYRMSRDDQKHVLIGVEKAAEAAAAAGAVEVLASTLVPITWKPALGGSPAEFADEVRRYGAGSNRMTYISFHQMGSAAMGDDPKWSVVGGDNQSHRTKGLYVMDGSAFPTASGVNPMISISTVAHRAAAMLAAELT